MPVFAWRLVSVAQPEKCSHNTYKTVNFLYDWPLTKKYQNRSEKIYGTKFWNKIFLQNGSWISSEFMGLGKCIMLIKTYIILSLNNIAY